MITSWLDLSETQLVKLGFTAIHGDVKSPSGDIVGRYSDHEDITLVKFYIPQLYLYVELCEELGVI